MPVIKGQGAMAAWLAAVAAVALSFNAPPPPPAKPPAPAGQPICISRAGYTDCTPAGWNGYRVFLSVACHDRGTGACHENPGCDGFGENANSLAIARALTFVGTVDHPSLVQRGYAVRIGTGLMRDNIANSNGYLEDRAHSLHVPLHSNAFGNDACLSSVGGTELLFNGFESNQAADALLAALGPASPGTGDRLVERPDLAELNSTRAVSAYVEAEYHTWRNGVDWLNDPAAWAWRLSDGIDNCFGTPRAQAGPTTVATCRWSTG